MSSWFKSFFGSKCISCICLYPKAMPLLLSAAGDCSRLLAGLSASASPGLFHIFSTEDLTATNQVMYELVLGIFKPFPVAFRWKGKLCLPIPLCPSDSFLQFCVLSHFSHPMEILPILQDESPASSPLGISSLPAPPHHCSGASLLCSQSSPCLCFSFGNCILHFTVQ